MRFILNDFGVLLNLNIVEEIFIHSTREDEKKVTHIYVKLKDREEPSLIRSFDSFSEAVHYFNKLEEKISINP